MNQISMTRSFALHIAAAFVLCAAATGAVAQAFPSKPVKLLIPYPPGGTTDLMARALQDTFQKTLGQPLVVENRAGAAGGIAAREVARAAPDGYTLLFPNNGITIAPQLQKDAGYDPVKDFAPVSLVSIAPMLLVIHPSVPANNLREFLDFAKRQPGGVEFGSAGSGATGHLASELLGRMAGFKGVHVPYKGQAPSSLAVMTGEVKMLITTTSASMNSNIQAGKLRLLGVSTATQTPVAPEARPIAETVPGFSAEVWFGILAPAGTPREAISKLSETIAKALADPESQRRFLDFGVVASSSTPGEFAAMIARDVEKWSAVVRQVGLRAD